MNKKVTFSVDARKELAAGVNKLANAVTATLGPSGRTVLIEQDGSPVSTKDGVTVAKAIELKNKVQNIGAQVVKQASIKTADQAGDGTTTSTLLAQEILNYGLSQIQQGTNSVEIKRGIDKAVKEVVEYLAESSSDITNEEQLKQVATISANNDLEVGEIIASAMDEAGQDGVVTIEESKTGETYLEVVEGMQFDRGYKSPYFVTDNNTMQAVLNSPLILITDKRLSQVKELLPILEGVSQQNKPLLIIADDIDGEALSTLVVNKMRGNLQCVAVKAPQYGDRKKVLLEDIATLTGGTVVSTEKGMRLDKFQSSWFGSAKKATVGKELTTIIDANGDAEQIQQRVSEIKTQIDETVSPYEKEILQDRLGKFIGGVSVVYVGGHTEVEMKEKKDRVDDALHATKAALQEGILPGGGIALLNASLKVLDSLQEKKNTLSPAEQIGYEIIAHACMRPFTKILENAGFDVPNIEEIKAKILSQANLWKGYNPRTAEYVDMFQSGIIDPAKVTRLALENAASVAGTLLTTEAVITPLQEKNNSADPGMLLG